MLDVRLFERHSGGADLTEAGRVFFERSQIIGLEYQHALEDIRNVRADQEATIRIGAGPIWSSTVMPRVTTRFQSLFPRHRLSIETGMVEDLVEDLRLGRIDIFAGAQVRALTPPGFISRRLARCELVVMASGDHPLFKGPAPVDLAEMVKYPFVAFRASQIVLETLSTWLKVRNVAPPHFMVETSSLYACVELARTGNYLLYETSLIPQNPIGKDLAVLPVGGPIHEFDIGLIYRDGLERIGPFQRLMGIMQEVLSETLADDPEST